MITEADHCRIGSLEITNVNIRLQLVDHCRIGSLENEVLTHDIIK